ncbi:MAG: AAA family ATPase [Candidatus Thiodiazotropha sp. LLP2]
MYISKISIENFRNFEKCDVLFNDGINVIIGPNNAGKTNLIKALSLLLDTQESKRLQVEDFSKFLSLDDLKKQPPKIRISATIQPGDQQELDDLVMISHWLTRLDPSYEAKLTYEFYLPEEEIDRYLETISGIGNVDPASTDKAWKIIKHDFIRLYKSKLWAGDPELQAVAEADSVSKFDFQFLSAIRDVERDMFTGRNTLLREVIDFFMDYEIKSLPEDKMTKVQKNEEIKQRKHDFSEDASLLIEKLQIRMSEGKSQILSYAKEIGASFDNATPSFEGSLSDVEMYSALQLIVEYETGIKIPATHNGLGYNNLIYMSLLLAKMQINSDGEYLGSNSKVFSTLVIEEPEAHLHPSMQYKFLTFLRDNKRKRKVRQIFISTHSTHITSAISLDEIICVQSESSKTQIGYPGKVFPDDKNKKYVQRFLDATKSDMLFASRVLLVEGLAEQLLLPIFARYLDSPLEDKHITVINVGGRYFDHFLHLFEVSNKYALPKKIGCLTDRDPERRSTENGSFRACYPYQLGHTDKYEYQDNSSALIAKYKLHTNIRFFSQDENKGKTLEYDLVSHNPTLKMMVTDSMSNKEELESLMDAYDKKKIDDMLELLKKGTTHNDEIKEGVQNCKWPKSDNDDLKAAIIASRYLNSVGKGENALELAYALENNLLIKGKEEYQEFNVPPYICDAIQWLSE